MKPQSLETQRRIQQRQEKALDEIRRRHEREAWEPIQPFEIPLPTNEAHRRCAVELENLLGKRCAGE